MPGGWPQRRFAEAFARDLGRDDAHLRRRLQRDLDRFRARAQVDLNNPAAVMIVDWFGLVYAAARQAQRWGVFPARWRCGPAILTCYQCYYGSSVALQPAAEIIEALAAREDVMNLSAKPKSKCKAVRAAQLFVSEYGGKRVLLIRAEAIEKLIPDCERFLARSDTRALLRRDGNHLKVQRRLPGEGKMPMYVFDLPQKRKPRRSRK